MDKSLFTTEPFLTGKPLEPFLTDPKQIKAWLGSVGITDWSINDGLVDVVGAVDLERKLGELKRLPVRFGKVGGHFWCQHNQLVSLVGMPKEVGGFFSCGYNKLVSLEGAPKQVGGDFSCQNNQLVSLDGAPERVVDFKGMECASIEGHLYVTDPKIAGQDNVFVSLEGLPKNLYGKVKGLDIQSLLALESQHSGIPDIEI